jgi:aryl-alcohol dehydrogenase-like predicted oxidoreductase
MTGDAMFDRIQLRTLGASDTKVPPMGIGTMLWDFRKSDSHGEIMRAYLTCLDHGLSFFDTAEIYAKGNSERLLGECLKKDGRRIGVASKFAPPSSMIPLTLKRSTVPKESPGALIEALDDSLRRLGVDVIDLYQIHANYKLDVEINGGNFMNGIKKVFHGFLYLMEVYLPSILFLFFITFLINIFSLHTWQSADMDL